MRRGVPAIVATCAVTLIGSGLWLGYRFVTTSDRFAIDDIEIHGNVRMTRDQITSAMPVRIGDNVFTADLDGLTAQLRAEPWVEAASVRRVLPSRIVVDVREHTAAVVVAFPTAGGAEKYLADSTGHAFKRLADSEGEGLPMVAGIERDAYRKDPEVAARQIVTALDVLRRWRDGDRPVMDEAHLDSRGTSLIARGLEIQLGEGNLDARLRTFDAVWSALGTDERTRVRTVHLDARLDHVTIAFSPT